MGEWNCQLNISSNRCLHCRMLRNLFLLNRMGKPEKSCIWSGSGTAVKRDWSRLSASVCQSSHSAVHLSTVCSHTSDRNPSARCPGRPVCDDHPSVHTQLLLWAWETPGPWLFLFLPPTQWELQLPNRDPQMPY